MTDEPITTPIDDAIDRAITHMWREVQAGKRVPISDRVARANERFPGLDADILRSGCRKP